MINQEVSITAAEAKIIADTLEEFLDVHVSIILPDIPITQKYIKKCRKVVEMLRNEKLYHLVIDPKYIQQPVEKPVEVEKPVDIVPQSINICETLKSVEPKKEKPKRQQPFVSKLGGPILKSDDFIIDSFGCKIHNDGYDIYFEDTKENLHDIEERELYDLFRCKLNTTNICNCGERRVLY